MSDDERTPETADAQPETLQSEVDRRFSEMKGALDVLQKNLISQQQLTSVTNIIEERLDIVKKEVDALQVEIMKPAKPWYRNASVVVSLVAVLFSFVTAAVSYQHIRVQDRRAARTELRQLIQRMAAIPKENIELMKAYEKDAGTSNILSGFINQENNVIARQAAEIIERIPDDVTAHEYHAVAGALLASNNFQMVPALIERGLAAAKDYSAELELLRLYGNVLAMSGDLAKARTKYQEALDLPNKHHMPYPPYLSVSNAITRMNWIASELGQGQCQRAGDLLSQNRDELTKLPASPQVEGLKQQVANFEEVIQKNRQNCKD